MDERVKVLKTYKLFIDGAFPRSESGRSLQVKDATGATLAHLCMASRKDLRDAVEAARRAYEKWAGATAYNRGQVLYRIAEMMEGKADELAGAIASTGFVKAPQARREVGAAVDRMIYYAGWADKYAQVLGCNNPVAGPYYNFTVMRPTGVVACICPRSNPLLGLVSMIAPVIVSGNAVVAVDGGENPIPAAVFAEVCATSDVPPGVVNILTGKREELCNVIASHRDIDAVHAASADAAEIEALRAGAASNLKRVTIRREASGMSDAKAKGHPHQIDWFTEGCQSVYWIEPFVEAKTIWHPSSV